MLVNVLCLRTEFFLHIFYSCFLGWGDTTEKNYPWRRALFSVKWARSIQEFLTCPLYVTCELTFLPRKECLRSVPLTWPVCTNHEVALCWRWVSCEGTLSSRSLETDSERNVNMMQMVGELWLLCSPGGASMEELLSQLPDDVIGSVLKKEDLGRPPPPFCILSTGRVCHQVLGMRSLWSKGVCHLWSIEDLYCDLLGQGHCVTWWVCVSLEAEDSYVTLKCWVFSCRTTWYPNPRDHNMVGYAVCKATP
jgi:hypothetical protein